MTDIPEGLGLVELLDLLEPIPEPPPVDMTPQTVGWAVLGAVALAVMVTAVVKLVRWRRANAYRRAALAQLSMAGDDPARIAGILRRAALAAFPRRDVAALAGKDWLAFLDRSMDGSGFDSGAGRALLAAPYRPVPPDPALTDLAGRWIRDHKSGNTGKGGE